MARRASLVQQLRGEAENAVVLDLGNMADVGAKYEPVLAAAALLHYQGVAPSQSDRKLASGFEQLISAKGIPLVPELPSAPTDAFTPLIVRLGNTRVALATLSASAAQRPPAALLGPLRFLRDVSDMTLLIGRVGLENARRLAATPEVGPLIGVILEAEGIRWEPEPVLVNGTAADG